MTHAVLPPKNGRQALEDWIAGQLAVVLGCRLEEIDVDRPFIDMGADSLILAEAILEINRQCGISLSVGQLYDNVDSVSKLARYVEEHGPRVGQAQVEQVAKSTAPDIAALPPAMDASASPGLIEILHRQLKLMEQQIALLAGTSAPAESTLQFEAARSGMVTDRPQPAPLSRSETGAGSTPDRFAAFDIRLERDTRSDDAIKAAHIEGLASRSNTLRPKSKAMTERYRRPLADNRVSAGFRPLLKELIFPVIADRAAGATLTDIDGREYIDFTMGFGVHLFGHAPAFITKAISRQLKTGVPIGPQSPLAGEVAELVCTLTGHDRALFCNSGSEATMVAVRLARAATGKKKIVVFRDSYHGVFDGFLARAGGDRVTVPASRGTVQTFVDDTIVLDYGADHSLEFIESHFEDIGAVLVEPVQSRKPLLQPRAFLSKLREITRTCDIALLFDETITGFRCSLGGAQAYFEVKADICTYGKVIGGGMPIGVVAGAARFMDGVDGGAWEFGDRSYPGAETIFLAGTFSKHPLTMASAHAVLHELRDAGPQLQEALNARTEALCHRLERVFETYRADIRVEWFSSLFRFASIGNLDLFFHHLLLQGIFVWEGRNCFLSTAHGEAEIEQLVAAVDQSCAKLAADGLLPVRTSHRPIAISDAQRRFATLHTSGEEGAIAANLCFGFHFPTVNVDRLARATEIAVGRHDALSARLDFAAGQQILDAVPGFSAEHIQIETAATKLLVEQLLADDQNRKLDPAICGVCIKLYHFIDGSALLSLCVHHLLCDGWGLNNLLTDIAEIYAVPEQARVPAPSYNMWLLHESKYRESPRFEEDARFWKGQLALIETAAAAESERSRVRGRPGLRMTETIEPQVTTRVDARARANKVTRFVWLLTAFRRALQFIHAARAPVVGVPVANRTSTTTELVGNCVNLLPIWSLPAADPDFASLLAQTRTVVADAMEHARYPYWLMQDNDRNALHNDQVHGPVEYTFNIEPITDLPSFDGIMPRLVMAPNSTVEFNCMCNIFVIDGAMRIELDFASDALSEIEAASLLNLFVKIVESESAVMAAEEAPRFFETAQGIGQ